MKTTWIDRTLTVIAPRYQLKRLKARITLEVVERHYEAAGTGRRNQGWRSSNADANALIGVVLATVRERARDLVRNNPHAESALGTIADHAVGWGIVAKSKSEKANQAWKAWAETTDCDADGRNDIYGLQKLVKRTVVESGEVLVRRRFRRLEDGFSIPMQLQVLDPDFLDTTKEASGLPGGGRIIQGVEFDGIGRRRGYHLFKEHPGSAFAAQSSFVPATEIVHVFRQMRPGQVRGLSWYAPVLLRFKDFDEFEDATLMKQKIAACLAVLTSDVEGNSPALGEADDAASRPIDSLEPGMILNVAAGRNIEVVQPPQARDYDAYSKSVLRAIATGLGVTYEDLTGDYTDMPFSAARMSRLRHWARVDDWRWRILIPQFCTPVWRWAMQAAAIMQQAPADADVTWSAPPPPMVDPANEGLAIMRNVRAGIQSLSDALRERGLDPETVFAEMAADNATLDRLKLVLDCDPRKMTQAGQLQGDAAGGNRGDGLARFADFLARVGDDRATEILQRMFGESAESADDRPGGALTRMYEAERVGAGR